MLLLLPVGLTVRYAAGAFSLMAAVGPVPVKLPPKRTARRDAPAADRRTAGLLRRLPGPLLRAGAGCALRAAGRLRGKVRLTRLRLRFTAGGPDPAGAVMAYARAGLAMEGIAALCACRVWESELRVDVDFDGPSVLEAEASARVRAGYLLWAAICFCFSFLREYYRYKKTEG